MVDTLRKYLGADQDGVFCEKVDREYRTVSGRIAFPEPTLCFDKFWYFNLGFNFRNRYWVTVLVGVDKTTDGFLIRFGEKDYSAELEFYEALHEGLKNMLSNPLTKEPKKFGFVLSQ